MPWDFSDAERKNERLIHGVADMRLPMEEAEGFIREAVDRNFTSQSDGETAWQPLKPATVKDRIRHGYPGERPILERTRTLRGDMKGSHDHESAQVGPSEDIPYAAVHNDGSRNGRIPARPYLRIAEEDADKIDAAINRHFDRNEG